jgi:hypothetical protein
VSTLAVYYEARQRAARAILVYCQRADEENTRNLADASRALATAAASAAVARAPSQQDRAALLARTAAGR